MSRVFLRRGRVLPGPLKLRLQAERRSPVPLASLALTSAALAAGLLLMPELSPGVSVDPTPMVEYADAAPTIPEARAFVDSAAVSVAATPARVEVVSPEPEPSRPAPPAPAKQAAAVPGKPAADSSLFQLDRLPVLEASDAEVDIDAATPPQVSPKPLQRRTPAANRGAAVAATAGSDRH